MSAFPPTHRDTIVTDDGTQLHTQHWAPPSSPEATILLVHGYAEHCNRYGGVAQAFVAQNVCVHAYDQRGYGRSGGLRAYVDSFETYLNDLDHVLHAVRAQAPERPLFLFGHSMGGLVVLKYVLDRAPSLRGLLLSAPALEINPDLAPLLRRTAQLLGRLWPTLPTTRSPEDAISRDPTVVAEAEADPLNYHGRVLARTGAEMLRAGQNTRDRLHTLDTPFLVLHGTADSLTNPAWSRALYEQASADDKTIRLYDGLYHEIFHEPEKEQVLGDFTDWVRARLP